MLKFNLDEKQYDQYRCINNCNYNQKSKIIVLVAFPKNNKDRN